MPYPPTSAPRLKSDGRMKGTGDHSTPALINSIYRLPS